MTDNNAITPTITDLGRATPTETDITPTPAQVEGVIDAFIASLDLAPRSKSTYRRALRAWARYLESIDVTQATPQTVLEYKDHLTATTKAATVNAYLTALRRFYRWMSKCGYYPDIASDIKGLKRSKYQAKDALTKDQAKRLLATTPDSLQGLRDYAMISLMMRAGLRTIEITRADYGDIRNQNGGLVLYVQGKGYTDKGDYIVLTDAAATPIFRYLDARREAGEHLTDASPLFASISNRNHGGRMSTRSVSRIVKRAYESEGVGSARLTAHSLRHTAVTFALEGGASLQAVQAMARHANINTTMIYAHNLDRMNSAAERDIEAYLTS